MATEDKSPHKVNRVQLELAVHRRVLNFLNEGIRPQDLMYEKLPPPNPEGPFPLNLFMPPGEADVDQMIASTEHGLLVTRFHYTNIVHPVESTITGMTRDGTFLIQDGRIAHPVKNLRFTQSILEALTGTEMIGRETELASEFFFSASRVPALKVSSFNFSGRSDH